MRFGKIPSKMVFICAVPKIFKCGWEDIDVSIAEDRDVVPCFAADADSADSLKTGRTWASHHNISSRQPDVAPVEQIEDNSPRKLWVVGLDIRQEGGRGWKVIDSQSRLFDLREDVLMEMMMSEGSTSGGALNGEYIFARVGTQMRLIRVGSALHAEMLKGEARRTAGNIPVEELEVGGLYANRKGTFIYLGRVDTVEEIFWGFGSHCKTLTALGGAEHKKLSAGGNVDVIQRVEVIGEHVSLQLSKHDQKNPINALDNSCRNGGYNLQFGKSITAVELIEKLNLKPKVLEIFRANALERLSRILAEREKPKFKEDFGEHAPHMMRADVRNASAMCNLQEHGQGASLSSEYTEALARCDISEK